MYAVSLAALCARVQSTCGFMPQYISPAADKYVYIPSSEVSELRSLAHLDR